MQLDDLAGKLIASGDELACIGQRDIIVRTARAVLKRRRIALRIVETDAERMSDSIPMSDAFYCRPRESTTVTYIG